jgi:hypothetical protein
MYHALGGELLGIGSETLPGAPRRAAGPERAAERMAVQPRLAPAQPVPLSDPLFLFVVKQIM